MQKITPCLWFDGQAEEAAKFYTSVFKNSKMGALTRYPEGSPGPAGEVMTATFQVEGINFTGLNGGPQFQFNESISFIINCETQEEVDEYWEKLTEGGEIQQCGWVKDKFGVSWQIVPVAMFELFKDNNKERSKRVMDVMLQMKKLDINALREAYGQQ